VGWLAPQITIFYNFGERIARGITFNIADWLDGNISFGQGLINVAVDTFNSFVQLGIDQLNFWLPPLPPLPPLPLAVKQTPLTAAQGATPPLQPTSSTTKHPQGVADSIRFPFETPCCRQDPRPPPPRRQLRRVWPALSAPPAGNPG
jgi:hypothetical protein